MKKFLMAVAAVAMLAGCQQPGVGSYNSSEVGRASRVEFGRVVSSRPVHISGENTGLGALGGAGAGGLLASGGHSTGAILAGGLAGALIGGVAEQQIANREGVEYVIALRDNDVITLTQNLNDGDQILPPGARVIIQQNGQFQRVIPADSMPTGITRAPGIKQYNGEFDNDLYYDDPVSSNPRQYTPYGGDQRTYRSTTSSRSYR